MSEMPGAPLTGSTAEDRAIDAALGMISSVQPRDGLSQRVMAGLASAPAETAADGMRRWMASLTSPRAWAGSAAALVIVAAAVTFSTMRHPAVVAPAVTLPHPVAQPAGAAAAVAVGPHPLEANTVHSTHHRGIRRSARAVHSRVPLPRGTVAPARPAVSSASH